MVVAAALRHIAPWGVLAPRLVEAPGAKQVLRLERVPCVSPGYGPPGQKEGFGKMLAHQIQVVDDDHDGSAFAVPAFDKTDQVADRFGVHRVEWFIQKDQIGVLDKDARKERSLQLPAGKRFDRTVLETAHPDRHERGGDAFAIGGCMTPEQAAFRPETERDEVDDPSGEGAVDFRLLRQVGDA